VSSLPGADGAVAVPDAPARAAAEPPRVGAPRKALRGAGDFLRRVYEKAADDNIFFLAGAIAFNVLVAFPPLALAVLGIAGTILRTRHTDPVQPLVDYILNAIPPVSHEFEDFVRQTLTDLVARSAGFLSVGTVLLAWLSTRLVGTLRAALREVFDVQQDRGIIAGKIFDLRMVLLAGTLFAFNVGLTISLEVAASRGLSVLGLDTFLRPSTQLYGRIFAFVTIWAMFMLIYRYLPARRISWSTSLIAATFTAMCFELLKLAFAWYATNFAEFSTYGNFEFLIVLIFWIYYTAVIFILGGEVAQVATMQRIRRRQKQRLR
jgi:membrane protein